MRSFIDLSADEERQYYSRLFKLRKQRSCCMFKDATGAACKHPSINSHVLQRKGPLKAISDRAARSDFKCPKYRKDHVSYIRADLSGLIFQNKSEIAEISWNNASAFYGFCTLHDGIFKPAEHRSGEITPEIAALLFYRSTCREIVGGETKINAALDFNIYNQRAAGTLISTLFPEKIRLEDLIHSSAATGEGRKFLATVWEFDSVLPFCASAPTALEIELLNFDKRTGKPAESQGYKRLIYHLYIGELLGKHVAIIGGFDDNQAMEHFIQRFKEVPGEILADVLLHRALAFCENIYFDTCWLHGLPAESRQLILDHYHRTIPGKPPVKTGIYDGRLGLLDIKATNRFDLIY